jgi:hypothetical protein
VYMPKQTGHPLLESHSTAKVRSANESDSINQTRRVMVYVQFLIFSKQVMTSCDNTGMSLWGAGVGAARGRMNNAVAMI